MATSTRRVAAVAVVVLWLMCEASSAQKRPYRGRPRPPEHGEELHCDYSGVGLTSIPHAIEHCQTLYGPKLNWVQEAQLICFHAATTEIFPPIKLKSWEPLPFPM